MTTLSRPQTASASTFLAALVGFAVTALTLGPRALDADDGAAQAAIGQQVAAATPVAVRAVAKLVPDKASPSGWSAEIRADNPQTEPADLDAHVRVAEFRGNKMSRMPAMPVTRFETEVRIELAAGGHRTFLVPVPKSALPARGGKAMQGTSVAVNLRGHGTAYVAADPHSRRLAMLNPPDLDDLAILPAGQLFAPPAPAVVPEAPLAAQAPSLPVRMAIAP